MKLTQTTIGWLREIASFYKDENKGLIFLEGQVRKNHPKIVTAKGKFNSSFLKRERALAKTRRAMGTPNPSNDILEAKFSDDFTTPNRTCCDSCDGRTEGCNQCSKQRTPANGFHTVAITKDGKFKPVSTH